MFIQRLSRVGAALSMLMLISSCSLIGLEAPETGSASSKSAVDAPARSNDCRWNRSSCIHEGAYEPKEKDYAEQEAKRLNRIALEKLRRSAGR